MNSTKSLVFLHQRYKDTAEDYQSRTSAQEQFERSRWFTVSHWSRLGYSIKFWHIPITQSFQTPHGRMLYNSYHASQVELRPAVWSKMLRACGRSGSDCQPTLLNRRRIHNALLVANQTKLAERLKHSLGSSNVCCRNQSRRDWLIQKTELALMDAKAARDEYSLIMAQKVVQS